jgi:hypothetical protein
MQANESAVADFLTMDRIVAVRRLMARAMVIAALECGRMLEVPELVVDQ